MDIYEMLRREARATRTRTIKAAEERYKKSITYINGLHKLLDRKRVYKPYAKDLVRSPEGTPYGKMTITEAAERVLAECGPMTIAELVVELQMRGVRPNEPARKVHHAVSSSFHYHKNRFIRDDNLLWGVI